MEAARQGRKCDPILVAAVSSAGTGHPHSLAWCSLLESPLCYAPSKKQSVTLTHFQNLWEQWWLTSASPNSPLSLSSLIWSEVLQCSWGKKGFTVLNGERKMENGSSLLHAIFRSVKRHHPSLEWQQKSFHISPLNLNKPTFLKSQFPRRENYMDRAWVVVWMSTVSSGS